MTREEVIERFNGIINAMSISIAQSKFYPSKAELDELCDIAIQALSAEAVQGECRTCKRSSDYLWKNGENGTRCPIEEHYALPKDGYCHLYDPYKGGEDE